MLIAGSSTEKINDLNKQLSGFGSYQKKKSLGMRITRDKANGTLKLS